jgi:hypothetical protein
LFLYDFSVYFTLEYARSKIISVVAKPH